MAKIGGEWDKRCNKIEAMLSRLALAASHCPACMKKVLSYIMIYILSFFGPFQATSSEGPGCEQGRKEIKILHKSLWSHLKSGRKLRKRGKLNENF